MRVWVAARISRLPVLAAAAIMLTGCGSTFDPFTTIAREAQPGQPMGVRVGVCYNTLVSSLDAVQQTAQQDCPKDTSALSVDTDWHLQACPLLIPAHASFVCTKPPTPRPLSRVWPRSGMTPRA